MKHKTSKVFSVIYICIVSCFLLSSYLATKVWAKCFSEAEGSDSARVAKWDVTADYVGEVVNPTFTLSEETEETKKAEYKFRVTSNSEVALSYDVILTWSGDLPAGVSFELDGKESTPDENNTVTFSEVGTFTANAGTQSKEHTLTIYAVDFSVDASLENIVVKVIASQILPN